ncbi:MAG: YfhO family protein, partial [Gemmatimonadota bacterium]|nr:YfhO family protein [Gemmatimonadota bacterium]
GASLLAIMFALGSVTPVHRIAHAVVPMIASFRAPAMMMSAVAVFVSLLAGFGWEAALRSREDGELNLSWVWLGFLGLPLALLALAAAANPGGLQNWVLLSWYPAGWPRQPTSQLAGSLQLTGWIVLVGLALAWGVSVAVSRRKASPLLVIALLAWTIFDLGRVGGRYLLTDPAAPHVATDPIIDTLLDEAGPGERIWAIQLEPDMYRPNRFMFYGLSSATGSQKFVLDPYARLVAPVRIDETLLQMGGVLAPLLDARYLITRTEQPEGSLDLRAEAGGKLLYRLTSDVPHAFFPASVEAVGDPAEAVERTRSNTRPLDVAVVEGRGDPPEAGEGEATIALYEPDAIELDVEARRGGLLVVSEIHHPGWRASVDGDEVPILRTNAAFRGVEVPAGTHRIRFEFHSTGYSLGRWLSLLVSIGLLATIVLLTLRERSQVEAS